MNLNLNDPQLTAYALGELNSEEQADLEAHLSDDEPARAFVADLRATARRLSDEFALESSPGLDDARRAALFTAAEFLPSSHLIDAKDRSDVYHVITHPTAGNRRYRFELFAIAASVALVATLLTLVFTSVFRSRKASTGPFAENAARSTPLIVPQFTGNADRFPEIPEGFSSRLPRDLIAQAPEDVALPFGVSAIALVPNPLSTTQDSGGFPGLANVTLENPFFDSRHVPVSVFAYHVGNGSYSAVRHAIEQKQRPSADTVRIEQLINYFPYHYAAPINGETFAADIEIAACPWLPQHRLVRIGLKGKDAADGNVIAENLQIRVEFNPAQVGAYRLIGYDRRSISRRVSGDSSKHNQIIAGQSVTALYEVIPAGGGLPTAEDALKYQSPAELTPAARTPEWLTVQLRYIDPIGSDARLQSFAAADRSGVNPEPSNDFKFAAAVAGFGLVLRESPHRGEASYDLLLTLSEAGQRSEILGERSKFIELLQQARRL